MKNICLMVQGGKFLLGISAEDVLARTAWAEVEQLRKKNGRTVHLGALLSRQPGGAVPPDAVCLELQGEGEAFFLLIDRIVDEAEVINPPVPLPPACPPLAARLCPQVTIWGDTPVLLLDPAQVLPVATELGKGIVLLAAEEDDPSASEPEFEHEAEEDEQDDPFFPVTEKKVSLFAEEEAEEISEPEEEPVAFLAEPASARADISIRPADSDADEQRQPQRAAFAKQPDGHAPAQHTKETASTIDEDTFKKVMNWTIARFKQSRAGEELHLGIEQLPPALAGMVEQKGLSKNIIQYLIDQIVLRCKETENAGRRLPGEKHAG